jgi:hypothetical protein
VTFEGSGQFLVRGTFDRGDLKEVAGRRARELLQLSFFNEQLEEVIAVFGHRLALTEIITRGTAHG